MDALFFGGCDQARKERNAVLRDDWLNDRHATSATH
jgi:hypothetical protein